MRTLGEPSGARGGMYGSQSGTESRTSTLIFPLNGRGIGSPQNGLAGTLRRRRVSIHHPSRVMPDHPRGREASGVSETVKAPVKGMTWVPAGAFAMGSD